MTLPKPFDSRKLWATGMAIAAIAGITVTGHADPGALSALVAVGGGGALVQGALDYKEASK